jgi:hypothetical protein
MEAGQNRGDEGQAEGDTCGKAATGRCAGEGQQGRRRALAQAPAGHGDRDKHGEQDQRHERRSLGQAEVDTDGAGAEDEGGDVAEGGSDAQHDLTGQD